MKTSHAGLICAGGVTQSFLARMPSVLATLGPVMSVSLRVGRRMANSLRAGRAVDDPAEFRSCEVVWIAVPEPQLDRLLAVARRSLDRKIVILCDSPRESGSLGIPHAQIATLQAVDPDEGIFAAEGSAGAIREIRMAVARERRKLVELHTGSKALFLAGIQFSSRLMLPCFGAGVESLRLAGFSRAYATRVAETLGSRAIRAYSKAGRKAWSPSAAPDLRRALERDMHAIRAADPALAEMYSSAIAQALRYF